MYNWSSLPVLPLKACGPLSRIALALPCENLRELARVIQETPYGRPHTPALHSLFEERRGTCSSKHALLAAIGREMEWPLILELGIYAMDEANTPGVGQVLDRHGLKALPEAHCFVNFEGKDYDLTRSVAAAEPIHSFLLRKSIQPEDIFDFKKGLHRSFMETWRLQYPDIAGRYTADELWRIRESCIAALAES